MQTYKELIDQISTLQSQANDLREQERAAVIAEIKHKIAEYGLTAKDLGFDAKRAVTSKKAGRKVPVRYRDNNGNTWAGRGKRPTWLTNALSNGATLEQFAV